MTTSPATAGPPGSRPSAAASTPRSWGLFYGGHAPTWSHITLRHVLEEHLAGVRELAWIDLHTGLGPCGHGERIYTGQDTGDSLARARQWWGAGVTSLSEGNSSSAPLLGLMWSIVEPVFAQVAPGARYTGMALEFGTVPLDEMILALRADHWLEAHPEAPPEQAQAIKRQIRDAFYIDTPPGKPSCWRRPARRCTRPWRG